MTAAPVAVRAGWSLRCSACAHAQAGDEAAGVCPDCGQPLLAEYPALDVAPRAGWSMWRYAGALPLRAGEVPVSLGEGLTPAVEVPALARRLGVARLWVKDEGRNPTASFKARGMSAAVTRARALGARGLVVPTAGNAGAALAAYGAAAGLPVRVYAPRTTPAPILRTVRAFGAELCLVDGHIGDAGRLARADAAAGGWTDVSTFREPYRVEGKYTRGSELLGQRCDPHGRALPTLLADPTGGGQGTVGIWKAFGELRAAGAIPADAALPRMVVAQSAGCAPIVRAFAAGEDRAAAWESPATYASGLRVPSPLGDRLVLRVLRESGGDALAVTDDVTRAGTRALAEASGVDAAPEGGCALAALDLLAGARRLTAEDTVVLFNTGGGASYRGDDG